MPIFDLALRLRDGAAAARTATGSDTGVAIPVRFLPMADWVIHVTAIDAASTDETYVFTLEVSDLVGGTYTKIAEHVWPRAHGVGVQHIPISGDMASFQDPNSAFVRTTVTLGGTTPSVTFGSYLTKASNKYGIAVKPGDFPVFP